MITDGVNAVEKFVYQGQEYFKCVSSHLSEFTAGTAKKEGNKGNGDEGEGSNTGLVVGLVIAGIIVIALIIVGVICFKKKSASSFNLPFLQNDLSIENNNLTRNYNQKYNFINNKIRRKIHSSDKALPITTEETLNKIHKQKSSNTTKKIKTRLQNTISKKIN